MKNAVASLMAGADMNENLKPTRIWCRRMLAAVHIVLSLRMNALAWFLSISSCFALACSPSAQDSPPPSLQSVVQALRVHDNETALRLAQDFASAYPTDPRGWTLQGIALQALNRPNESLEAYQHALKLDPNNLAALEAAAQVEFQAGRPEALTFLEKLLTLKPDDQTAHAMVAALAYQQKDCPSTVGHYQKSPQIVANDIPALSQLGSCLFRLNRAEEALPVFERIAELRPGDPEAQYYFALAQYSARHYKEAIQSLLPLTGEARGKKAVAALNLLAAAYEADRQTPQAVDVLQKAISLAPEDISNYLDLATLSLDHGSFKLGVDVLNAGLRAVPNSAPLYLERGVLEVQLGQYNEARADFQQAAALNPIQNDSSVALGISLMEENRPTESVQVLRQRLEKSPNDPALNYLLAELLLRSGTQPGTSSFQEAETAAMRAVQGKPDFTRAEDLLAELYLRAGETGLAEQMARKALKSDPEDQSALYNLIICVRSNGDHAELSQLVQRLAEATANLREQEKARNRYRLVEEGAGHGSPQKTAP